MKNKVFLMAISILIMITAAACGNKGMEPSEEETTAVAISSLKSNEKTVVVGDIVLSPGKKNADGFRPGDEIGLLVSVFSSDGNSAATWSVSNNSSIDTYIDKDMLHVAKDEESQMLAVTAIPLADMSKSVTKDIPLKQEGEGKEEKEAKETVSREAEAAPAETATGSKTGGDSRGEGAPAYSPPAHTHSYSSEYCHPTCTESGYTLHACSCGSQYVDGETPALGHDYGSSVAKKATCQEEGTVAYACSRCGDSYTESIPRKSHEYRPSVTPATCQGGGHTTYTCAHCGDSYDGDYTDKVPHNFITVLKGDKIIIKCEYCGKVKDECDID